MAQRGALPVTPSWFHSADAIHLDHDAVDLVGQRLALLLPLADETPDLVDVLRQRCALRIHLEAGGAQRLQVFPVLFAVDAAVHQQEVGVEIEPAQRGDVGIEHAHRARPGIARIGKLGQPLALALFVHALERLARHDDLAADLEIRRQLVLARSLRRLNDQRHRADGPHIFRDVLADRAVAARDGPLQPRTCGARGSSW